MRRKGRGRQGSERRDLVLDVPGKGVRDEIWSGEARAGQGRERRDLVWGGSGKGVRDAIWSGDARARQGSEEGIWSGGAAPHLKYFLK